MFGQAQVLDEVKQRGYIAGNDVSYANRHAGHQHIVLAAIAAGLYPHVAQRVSCKYYYERVCIATS